MSFIFVRFRSLSTKSQVRLGEFMPRSRLANIVLVEFDPGAPEWQFVQVRVSALLNRRWVSVLRPGFTSTVNTSTVQPAASTRWVICSTLSHFDGAYIWYHGGRPSAAATSSTEVEETVESI